MLATYSEWGFCYSDAMIVVGQSQPLFKAGGSSQAIPILTRSAGYRYLKKNDCVACWVEKKQQRKKTLCCFF